MNAHGYAPVTEEVVHELAAIVGPRFVVTDPAKMEPYSHDEVAGAEHAHLPEAVAKPLTAEEVAAVVKLANRRRIPVTPRGAGSGLSGGAVPVYGGIVLSLERMNHILEVDQENMMAVVEPGVVTNDINERLAPVGLFYAGYPMSLETCYIGGNVAENAGGGKAVKYGVTERYVLGLQVVTPTGEIVELGGKRVKDVTGYNLLKLMVGSEGTLCVITRVTLRLLPLPRNQVALLVPFADVPSAIAAVPRIMTQAGVIPAAIEFMDRLSVHTSCRYLNEQLPYEQAGAMLLIEVDGSDEETVPRDYESIGELCLECGAQEVYVADNHTTRERLWRIRRNIAEAFKAASPHQSLEDIVVPPAAIPRIMPELERIAGRYGVQIPCYGHAGDGNLHATVVRSPEDSMEAWRGKLPQVLTELYLAARALGGTISGEHGIGSKRKEFMRLVASEAELDMMRRIKRALDPNNILNPGKIFDA
jgi:glycolate oxidase